MPKYRKLKRYVKASHMVLVAAKSAPALTPAQMEVLGMKLPKHAAPK